MKILILTGKFGMGHLTAANALCQEFEKSPYAGAKVIDIVEYMLPNMHNKIYKGFSMIAEKHPTIYNRAYTSSEKKIDLSFSVFFLKKLDRLLKKEKPDLIVSTLFLSTKIVSCYKRKTKSSIPLITCITDISSANEWITKETDLFMVATEEVKQELIEKGVHDSCILVSGIPVRQKFKQKAKLSSDTKARNNLLIMGGGLGLLPKSMEFYKRLNELPNTKTTIITGNNTAIFDKLYNIFDNIDVIGYSNQVHKHMQEADIILSKAGGITLFETIYSDLPILVPSPFLAQEINNAKYIEKQRIGKVVWDKGEDLVGVIEEMLLNEVELQKMKCNMKRLRKSFIDTPLSYIISFINLKEAAQ